MTSLDLDDDPEPKQPQTAARAPGLYPDPYRDDRNRYWDGTAWTEHTSDAGVCVVPNCTLRRAVGSGMCTGHAGWTPNVEVRGDRAIICPHCQTRGRVTSRRVKQKKGISGGKATGAILTAGVSLLGTGLSRKERATEMHCHHCNTKWYV